MQEDITVEVVSILSSLDKVKSNWYLWSIGVDRVKLIARGPKVLICWLYETSSDVNDPLFWAPTKILSVTCTTLFFETLWEAI